MINTSVNVTTTSAEILNLSWTEWAMTIVLWNEWTSKISIALGWGTAVAGSGIILWAGEKMVLDTKNVQINKISAVSASWTNALTIYADIATPANIVSLEVSSIEWDTVVVSWDFSANATSYDISFDNGTTWDSVGNVNTITKTLADGTYNVSVRGRKALLVWNAAAAIEFVIDTTSPTLDTVSIASNNTDTAYAKVWDVVTLTFVASEDLESKPVVTIAWQTIAPASVIEWVDAAHWTTTYTMASWDIAWSVPFTINAVDIYGNVLAQVSATTDSSAVIFDKTVPTLVSLTRDSNTQITVTLSEFAKESTITKANAGWFVVADTVTPATTYAVSAIAPWATDDLVVLTVASMAASGINGITVTYTQWGNGTVSDLAANLLATDAVGLSIPSWDVVPTMISAERIANTTLRVTISEDCDTLTTTKANDGWFVVAQTGSPFITFAVSAISPNGWNHNQIDLTVEDIIPSATTWVTVTYVQWGNGTVADTTGNLLATDATGQNVNPWA